MKTVEGAQFKIVLTEGKPGVESSSGTLARIWSEDDTNWFPVGGDFDALWLGDLEHVAMQAREVFNASENGKRAAKPATSEPGG